MKHAPSIVSMQVDLAYALNQGTLPPDPVESSRRATELLEFLLRAIEQRPDALPLRTAFLGLSLRDVLHADGALHRGVHEPLERSTYPGDPPSRAVVGQCDEGTARGGCREQEGLARTTLGLARYCFDERTSLHESVPMASQRSEGEESRHGSSGVPGDRGGRRGVGRRSRERALKRQLVTMKFSALSSIWDRGPESPKTDSMYSMCHAPGGVQMFIPVPVLDW